MESLLHPASPSLFSDFSTQNFNILTVGVGTGGAVSMPYSSFYFKSVVLLLFFHNSNGQQNSPSVEFWWDMVEGTLRRANTEPYMYFRRANTERYIDFRKANMESYMGDFTQGGE